MRRVLSGKRERKVFLLAACVAFACCLCLGACAVQQSELSTTGDAPMASETDAGTAILSPHSRHLCSSHTDSDTDLSTHEDSRWPSRQGEHVF